jgi:Tol biopolymer transport system component
MDFDGSEQEIVIPEHYSVLGNWSPNGDMFVFSATGTSRSDILVVNVVGNNLRNLTEESDIFATRSDWSPNGSQIVFSGFQHQGDDSAIADYNDNIWVMNADGSNLMNLTGGN